MGQCGINQSIAFVPSPSLLAQSRGSSLPAPAHTHTRVTHQVSGIEERSTQAIANTHVMHQKREDGHPGLTAHRRVRRKPCWRCYHTGVRAQTLGVRRVQSGRKKNVDNSEGRWRMQECAWRTFSARFLGKPMDTRLSSADSMVQWRRQFWVRVCVRAEWTVCGLPARTCPRRFNFC